MSKKILASFVIALVLAGCKTEPPKPPVVETVAVLLFDSEANDINAPDIMQELVVMALKNSPYRVSDIQPVNDLLNKAGIMDGGQLAIVDPTKLGKDLGVQALMFGYVADFDYTNIGFYLSRKVTLELKLVDVKTGQTLWENTGSGANRQIFLDKDQAKAAFAKGVAEQTVEKLFSSPLEEEAKLATISALRTLPGYSHKGFALEARKSKPVKSGIKDSLRDAIKKR